jgi:hypothetical protein
VIVALLVALIAAVCSFEAIRLAGSAMGVRSVDPRRATFVYDLAAISLATGHDRFPQQQLRALPRGGAAPSNTSEVALKAHFRPWGVTSLRGVAHMRIDDASLARRETEMLRHAWIRMIEQDPLAYLRERANLYLALVGISGQPRISPPGFFFGYQGLDEPSNYGHPLAFRGNYRVATSALGAVIGNRSVVPLDRPWIYLTLMVGSLAVLLPRRSSQALVAASMAAAVAFNQLFFFFALMAAAFRYEYLATIVGLICLVYAASTLAGRVHLDQPVP